jgi:hypothetical protein
MSPAATASFKMPSTTACSRADGLELRRRPAPGRREERIDAAYAHHGAEELPHRTHVLEVGLEEGGQPCLGADGLLDRAPDPLAQTEPELGDALVQQVLLPVEVDVEGAAGHAGRLGDAVDRGLGKADLADHAAGCLENLVGSEVAKNLLAGLAGTVVHRNPRL